MTRSIFTKKLTRLEMSERLKNKRLLKALEAASRLTETKAFLPIHAVVQLFHLTVTRACLKTYFKFVSIDVVDLRLRRSVTAWSSYHLLLSDVDITLIIKDSTLLEQEPLLFAVTERVRRRLIFIGEFEIYKESEFKAKERVEADLEPFYGVIRAVRKLSWLPENTQPYHRYKRERSLTKLQRSLEPWLRTESNQPSQLLAQWLRRTGRDKALTPVPMSSWSRERVDSFLLKGAKLLENECYNTFLTAQAGYTSNEEKAEFKNEDLWLHILSSQHERLMVKGRARIVDAAEAAHLLTYEAHLADEILKSKAELQRRKALASFDIYGVRVEVMTADDEAGRSVLLDIQNEWSYFTAQPSTEIPPLSMTLRKRPQVLTPAHWHLKTKLGTLTWFKNRRWIRYGDQTVAAFRQTEGGRAIEVGIASKDSQASIENLLHSSIGEQLEAAGFVRLHAAAYANANGLATVHVAKSGSGKSTLIATLLERARPAVYGDETILVRNGHVWPYPTRVALAALGRNADRRFMGSEKVLMSIPTDRVAAPARIEHLIFHTPFKFKLFQWVHATLAIALGLGLPQMKEYLIRLDSAGRLAKFLMQRLQFVASSEFDYQPPDIRENLDDRKGLR